MTKLCPHIFGLAILPPGFSAVAKMKMTKTEKLIRLCQKLPIKIFPDILHNHGFQYEYLGSGLSRQVYKIENLPVVMKLEGIKNYGCWQSSTEVKVVRLIEKLKKHESLRPFTPKIYYSKIRGDYGLILAHYYPLSIDDVPEDFYRKSRDKVQNLFSKSPVLSSIQAQFGEMSGNNIRFTESQEPVVVDLGCGA